MMQPQLPTLCQRQQQYIIFHNYGLSRILSLVVSLSRKMFERACFVNKNPLHSPEVDQ